MSFLDQVRRLPGLGAIPGGHEDLKSYEASPTLREREEVGPVEDSFGAGDMFARGLAITLVALAVVIFLVGTYFWTLLMAGNIGPLGFAMTPVGMYGILIVLIPVMGVIHSLWTSSDVKRRKAEVLRAARDKLRVSLLSSPDSVSNKVHSAPMPSSMLFGESEEDLRRRRREAHQRKNERPKDPPAE